MCRRLAARSLGIFQNTLPKATLLPTRAFSSLRTCSYHPLQYVANPKTQHRRYLSNSPERSITGQEAPSAQAYIKSGVISGKKDLVDVEKVIVIGSGGLSIGQAGEFDYSGKCREVLERPECSNSLLQHRHERRSPCKS